MTDVALDDPAQAALDETEPGPPKWWTFALLAYLPILLIDPGMVESDTKSYLYLDPSRLLAGATSMWDPHVGLGTVSHQNIGYLFPMGPYYWLMENLLHVAPWIAQRLWLGTLLFAAGMGMRYLLATLGVDGPGVPVAMLAYTFTPYALEYSARLSVLLGPWAALPFFVAFTTRAVRTRGWRYPALFALTVQLIGGVNATSLVYALVGPALYALYAVVATHESDWRRLWSAAWRTGLLTLITSLWWLSGLWVEGRYGLNVLRFTEKLQDVSATSYPYEILRGLGYWMFYGRDPVSFWNQALLDYTLNAFVILVSLLIPAIAMFAAATVRWRYRLYFVVLVVVGVAIAVGAAPYTNPSIAGAVFKSFAATSTLGLALRSTSRATPLVILGLAALLAVGINAFVDRMRVAGRAQVGTRATFIVGALCLANAAGAWHGTYYSAYLERGAVPAYWTRALAAADAQPHNTRLLSLPGSDFAAYTWGYTIDPIEPGLINRPFVARELVPFGSAAGANLLQALDRRLQEGVLDTNAVAPIARLMAVGDVLLRLDLQTDRFRLVPADLAWKLFTAVPPTGLAAPQRYGTTPRGRRLPPVLPDLAVPPATDASPPPVAIFAVQDPLPIVRTQGADAPVVVAGDGEGLVDLASAGLLDARRPILYAAAYATRPAGLRALPADAVLVLTDSNRRRAQREGLSNAYGYTEAAGEQPLVADPSDQRLEVFPGESDASRTVEDIGGVQSVVATSYGSSFGYTPAERPAAAFDGNPNTAWILGGLSDQRLVLRLTHPITTDHMTFVQPSGDERSPYISAISLRFDGGAPVRRSLTRSSQHPAGQTVRFPRRRFSTLEIQIDSVHQSTRGGLAGQTPVVGFSEIRVADDAPGAQPVRVTETVRLPTDLLDALGVSSAGHPLVVVMSSETTMDDAGMRREFTLPTTRSFSISGSVVLSNLGDEVAVDRALGLPDATHGGITATSNDRLQDPLARASSALDGNPATAWNTPVGKVRGARIRVVMPAARTIDHLDLELTADGRHSIATQFRITGDDGSRIVTLKKPPVYSNTGVDAVPVRFAPLHTRTLSVTITKYEPLVKRVGAGYVLLPAGIAELGIPGLHAPVPARLPGTCLQGLFAIDGRPISVRVTGSTADALRGRPVAFSSCGAAQTITLGPGIHRLVALFNPHNASNPTAFDLQRLVLASAAGGRAADAASLMTMAPSNAGPAVTVAHQSRTALTLRVSASSQPYWLVLGESINQGWHATIDGHDLGAPRLLDGYANGWLVPANLTGRAVTVSLEWVPQRVVWVALWLSLAGAVVCLMIVAAATRARRRRARPGTPVPDRVAAGAHEAVTSRAVLLEAPLARHTARSAAAVATLAVTAGVLVRPWVGILVGALAFWALHDRRVRLLVRYAPAAVVVAIAVSMAGAQTLEHYPTGTHWPWIFAWARIPIWIALFLLLADAVIEWMWRSDEGSQ
jgi:arabinofuranan 3-O-arabinosyltransferase